MRYLPVLALAALAGCVEVHRHDFRTVAEVAETQSREDVDYARFLAALSPTATAQQRAGIERNHEAEQNRLRAWRLYEESKGHE